MTLSFLAKFATAALTLHLVLLPTGFNPNAFHPVRGIGCFAILERIYRTVLLFVIHIIVL